MLAEDQVAALTSAIAPHGRKVLEFLRAQPDGAVALRGDPADGPGNPEPQDDPNRQFLVLKDGQPV